MGSVARDFPKPPPGFRLPNQVVEETTAAHPSRIFSYAPRSDDPSDGWYPITFQQISNGANYIAHEVDRTSDKFAAAGSVPTVAYVGPNDIRYIVFMLGCIKARHQALFISPRNSEEAQLSLFQATNCNLIYYAESFHKAVQPWIRRRPTMKAVMATSLETWTESSLAPFPYHRSYDDAVWDSMVVLHTSGSTGIPKPIVVRQATMGISDQYNNIPTFQGKKYLFQGLAEISNRVLSVFPMFHAAGILATTIFSVYLQIPISFLPTRPLEPDFIARCLTVADCDGLLIPPSLVDDMSHSEEQISILEKMNWVAFGGGNLSTAAGAKLFKRIKLVNVIASTEQFPYAMFYHGEPELWDYFLFDSESMGVRWDLVDKDEGINELVFSRKQSQDGGKQSIFYTFPDLAEWSSKDLFKAHPTLPNYWKYQGRADNVIVFSNGEKLNPVTMEAIISGHRDVKGALVVGQDRFRSALIIEPARAIKDSADADALIDDIWPLVETANQETVTHGRLSRSYIVVADPDRPFPRAGKGTIQRSLATKQFQDVISALYERAGDEEIFEAVDLDLTSEETLSQSILGLLVAKTGIEDLEPDTEFFSAGIDSLQVMNLSTLLRAGFKTAGISVDKNAVSPRVVYANPTAKALAKKLFQASQSQNGVSSQDEVMSTAEDIEALLAKYTANLPAPKPDPLNQGQTILVTGTTGSLGAYLLDQMCSLPQVKKVVALNRGDDGGASRQPAVNAARGLTNDFTKVEFLGVDMSQRDFGLGAKYDELLATADRVIHNAWPVNFNISVNSFEPYIRGVRNLVNFSKSAAKNVPIVFISSIGTADRWDSSEAVPETRLDDMKLATMGYGQSKLISSLILDAAAKKSGVPSASIRVGQIAGPRHKAGVWNRQEFIPSLIASSVYLGMLPSNFGPGNIVDWTPVEDIAGLVLDIAGVTHEVPLSDISGYFHGVNPAKTTWESIVTALREYYGDRIKKTVSFSDWLAALEKSADRTGDVDKNPAIKLLDTYRAFGAAEQAGHSFTEFATERTTKHSPTMKNLTAVTPELVKNWCDQWNF